MTTIRIKKSSNYSVIHNTPINDNNLSCEALGVITYLLSKPDDWIVQNNEIKQRFDIGRDKLARIFRELTNAGYMQREQTRTDSGQWEWDTTINEHGTIDVKPVYGQTIDVKTVGGKPTDGKHVDIVSTELPSTESLSTEKEYIQKSTKTPQKKTKPIKEPPSLAVEAYRENALKFPDKITWPRITEIVGHEPEDIQFWGDVVYNYIECGWYKGSIKNMLGFYERREIPGTKKSNGNGATKTNGFNQKSSKSTLDEQPDFDPETCEYVFPDGRREDASVS